MVTEKVRIQNFFWRQIDTVFMSAIYVLIVCSIPVALGFLVAFIYFAKQGQFDDDYTPSIRILMDDPVPEQETTTDPINKAKTNNV
jgi:cbb3-type cytochrome oxidase maturation protein